MRQCLLLACASLACVFTAASGQEPTLGPADPQAREDANFDPVRPVGMELQANVPDGFSVVAVGDLIISRPLFQYAGSMPGFKTVLDIFGQADVTYGNLETTIFDIRSFTGSPYSYAGDWTVAASPAVAKDLRAMGFAIVSRANNHAQDWGLEGMRETSRWLDEAGIAHAGAGESHGLARAPQYVESAKGRVALVSLASTFRPTSESLPAHGATPGRPGVSGLQVSATLNVPPAAIQPLAQVQCQLNGKFCGEAPTEGKLFGTRYQQAQAYSNTYAMDAPDLAEIYQSIRSAQQNADFVIVAVHAHECSLGCDDEQAPRGAADFLKQLAHDAIDSGADLIVVTGNHNLGPIEIYQSPARGYRPVFYGLGNFFWSDIQEFLPHDLFQANRDTLAKFWVEPDKATEYDLSAPLNTEYFAHAFTFQSVVADVRFKGNQLAEIVLHPIELGYGGPLTESGIPRVVSDKSLARDIFVQINEQNEQFGLPQLSIDHSGNTGVIRP